MTIGQAAVMMELVLRKVLQAGWSLMQRVSCSYHLANLKEQRTMWVVLVLVFLVMHFTVAQLLERVCSGLLHMGSHR